MRRIVLFVVLCILAFTLQTSGQSAQTATTYTFACPTVSLIPTVQSQLSNSLTPPVSAQVVFIGKQPDKNYCYKIETIRPNLELPQPTHIVGRITDRHDAPLMKSRVELRKYFSQRKQSTAKATTTDENGYFDIGTVEAGKYRFLASPNRAFQQPTSLKCSGSECELNIALQVNATDIPTSVCPVR